MAKPNRFVFIVLHVVAWLIFVGLSIEAGGLLVNFFFSIYNPDMVSRLYQKLDMSELYSQSVWAFYSLYSCILLISLMKVCLFYMVIQLLLKLDLVRPFSQYVAGKIAQMSYATLGIGLLSYIGRQGAKNLQHHGYAVDGFQPFWNDSQAFVLTAAVLYVIAAIFKRGVALQSENDLTV